MSWLMHAFHLPRRVFGVRRTSRTGAPLPTLRRSRCAMVQTRIAPAQRAGGLGVPRRRRGCWMKLPFAWRRCVMGSNHISNFGVWRHGARRQAVRNNSCGETRWTRPARMTRPACALLLRPSNQE